MCEISIFHAKVLQFLAFFWGYTSLAQEIMEAKAQAVKRLEEIKDLRWSGNPLVSMGFFMLFFIQWDIIGIQHDLLVTINMFFPEIGDFTGV